MFKLSKLLTNDTVDSADKDIIKYVFQKDYKVCNEDDEDSEDNEDNEEDSENMNCRESS